MPHHGGQAMGGGEGFGLLHAVMGATSALMMLAMLVAAAWIAHRKGLLPWLDRKALARRRPALTAASGATEAQQYLDMALAKGEISIDEYHERNSALRTARL